MSEETPLRPEGFAPGSQIASYLLEEQIGQGGMAVVFRAHDERLDRTVALKILSPALAADEAFRQRFIRESRAAAAVDDPHIIPVYEAGEAAGVLFIAMRFVRGGDARSLLRAFGPLPAVRAAEFVSQVAAALDAAHARGLVHRDVKPGNMLLDAAGGAGRPDHVYLSDFGLSKGSLQTSGLTGTGMFLGTIDYVSPEQIEGRPVDGRADQYALACAAFELFTGTPPFAREEAMAVMYAQLSEPPPSLTARRPDLPSEVDAVFARALAKNMAERYTNCRDFAESLRAALGIRPYDSGPSVVISRDQRPPTERVTPVPGSVAPGSGTATTPGDHGWPDAAAAAASGQPTRVVAGADRPTSRELIPPQPIEEIPGQYLPGRARPRWRSSAVVVAALIAALAVGGGGTYLALQGHNSSGHGGGGNGGRHHGAVPAALTLPGCSSAVASAPTLTGVTAPLTSVSDGNPFGVVATPDGKYVLAVTPTKLDVFKIGAGGTLTSTYSYTISTQQFAAAGATLTHNGKYLLIAIGNGVDVVSVSDLESRSSNPILGTMVVPGLKVSYARALDVVVSPDDQYVFVTLQFTGQMAVFNLRHALAVGVTGSAGYTGSVPLGNQPVGLVISPDGNWMYAASFAAASGQPGESQGVVTAMSMAKLETSHPASAVVSQVQAGCEPARLVVSSDGTVVWVTTRASNYLLGFNAERLRSNSKHALIAKVQVGQTPVGLILVNGGRRMIVSNTDINNTGAHNLAVVSIPAALAGKPALLGYIPSGGMPREFAVIPNTNYLVVSDNGSNQLQVVDLSKLH